MIVCRCGDVPLLNLFHHLLRSRVLLFSRGGREGEADELRLSNGVVSFG